MLPGLTGLVGPNGCGKGNVVDALRWAMGEGNARTLRGAEMEDVVSAGTAIRPGLDRAEVALTVKDGSFPAPFARLTAVQVSRRHRQGSVRNLGRYAASGIAWWPKRPSSIAALT